ncbi:MAG: hypothetical protein ACYTG1_10415 [Planctomycetota bacterium]
MIDSSVLLAGALGLVGAAGIALGIVALQRRDRASLGPVCRRLARDLALARSQRRLLAHMARSSGMPSLGPLVVSRGCFDHAAADYVRRYGRAAELGAIRRRVFG